LLRGVGGFRVLIRWGVELSHSSLLIPKLTREIKGEKKQERQDSFRLDGRRKAGIIALRSCHNGGQESQKNFTAVNSG